MARHVVDSHHFQRNAPDMGVSPDEILFRAQPGCPLELGELAIHCVQPLPENRPVLRQIVERLTAIENVDVHVGTTLVVAPSVARAARNMMRQREVDAERVQEQMFRQAKMRNDGYHQDQDNDVSPQPHHAYFDTATSSVRGQANTWRMTDESNGGGGSSRMIPVGSIMVGSQSTYKGNKRREPTDDSAIPLFIEARYRHREKTSDQLQEKNSSDNSEDVHFRMPLWDSINSPYNQQELQDWNETESVHISTIKGGTALRMWDQERGEANGNDHGDGVRHKRKDRRSPSQLSSLQLDLDDEGSEDGVSDEEGGGRREGYGFSSCSSGSSNGDDEEDNSSLFREYSDDSDDEDGAVYGHSRGPGESRHLYELSSDSDATQSTNSLTESVVLALDTLEIPDIQSNTDQERQCAPAATAQHQQPELSNGGEVGLQRKHSLASRLLPPVPAADNPWASVAPGQRPTSDSDAEDKKAKDTIFMHTNESSTATVMMAPASPPPPQQQTLVEVCEMDDLSFPPAPPSKTSFLLRNNTIKSTRSGGSVSPDPPETTAVVTPENKDPLSPASGRGSASTTGTTNSSATSSSVSGTSSPSSIVSPDEKSSQGSSDRTDHSRNDMSEKQEKVGGGRGLGLIRGMSDSFWGPSTSTAAPGHPTTTTAVAVGSSQTSDTGISGGGGTITSTLVAAMSAKTWTSGVGGFGQWIGPASSSLEETDNITSSPPPAGKGGLLKKHTSLKEGKQYQQQRAVANFDNVERKNGAINETGVATVGATVVKKRAPKALTGISHRFSLVGVSALLLPKCDVCQKRLGVLPGWGSKHLECDGKPAYF